MSSNPRELLYDLHDIPAFLPSLTAAFQHLLASFVGFITPTLIVTSTLVQGSLCANTPKAAKIKFPESNCGFKNKGGYKMLIAYASECGTTAEVAIAIGNSLCEDGNTVETKWIKNVKDINNYDAVIIGSAILYEKWMPEAREFVKNNQDTLKNMPVA